MRAAAAPLSLRGRALALLARREYGRVELARKLAPYAAGEDELGALLDSLEQAGHLSTQRFVESLVRRRSVRYGARRVAHELEQRGVAPAEREQAIASLRVSEADRAWEVWSSRYGSPPATLQERARQQRFLLARGFASDAITAVFRRLRDQPPSG